MMDTLSLSLNRLVPVVLAVGNHDVGLNSLSKINISTSNSDAPLYFQYFPQHYQRDHQTGAILSEVPEIEERKTYFAHMFAGTVFYTLDSGYINTFQGYQSKWLNDSLSENNNLIKFVHYHASSFPSCKFENNLEKTVNVQSLMYWNSLFDKYNVTAVYENYFHLLKRTWKLKGNTENINGTIYLGDGGWGDIDEQCTMNDDKFYVNVSRKQHVWVSKISAKIINFTAIGINGIVHDQHSQKI